MCISNSVCTKKYIKLLRWRCFLNVVLQWLSVGPRTCIYHRSTFAPILDLKIKVSTWFFFWFEERKVIYKFTWRRFLKIWIFVAADCLCIFRVLNQHFGPIFFVNIDFAMYSVQPIKICLKNVNFNPTLAFIGWWRPDSLWMQIT